MRTVSKGVQDSICSLPHYRKLQLPGSANRQYVHHISELQATMHDSKTTIITKHSHLQTDLVNFLTLLLAFASHSPGSMRAMMFFLLILAYTVVAGPILQTGLPTAVTNLSIHEVAYDTNPPPPGGPDGFRIMVSRPSAALHREHSLLYVAKVLLDEIVRDFHGSFEHATTVFRDGVYPHLEVTATVIEAGQRLPRRYFYWGMARIMDFMVDKGQFFERDFLLVWRGAHVGRITWRLVDIPDDSMNRYNATTLAQPAMNQTNAAVSAASDENLLSWTYTPYGQLMTITDIAMGTIASLVQAAQLPNQNLETFLGYWPQSDYQAAQSWRCETRPSQFGKFILVSSMYASLIWAHVSRNFQELSIEVGYDYQQVFAKGGHIKVGAPAAGNRPHISTS